MSIQVGDVLRVVAILSWLDGDIAQNVFNAAIGGTGGPFDDEDIVTDSRTWVGGMFTEMISRMSDELDGAEVRVYIYDSVDDDWDEVGSSVWGYNPSAADDQLPRGVAGLLNCKTLDPDVNGKKYLPGLTEAQVTDGLWVAGVITDMALFADEWVDPFVGAASGASFVPGVWSPTRTNFYAMTGTVLIPTIPAYQRRRKRGVGI